MKSITLVFAIGIIVTMVVMPNSLAQDESWFDGSADPEEIRDYALQIQRFMGSADVTLVVLIVNHKVVFLGNNIDSVKILIAADKHGYVTKHFLVDARGYPSGNAAHVIQDIELAKQINRNALIIYAEEEHGLLRVLNGLDDILENVLGVEILNAILGTGVGGLLGSGGLLGGGLLGNIG